MRIKIVNYTASASPLVQAFVSIEIDGWLRFNGLNLLRDGTLRPAQLTPIRNGKRLFFDAVQILDADLTKRLTADILAVIRAYVELLPPERRLRPPVAPKPRSKPNPSSAAQGVARGPTEPPPAPPAAAPPPKANASPPAPKLKPLPPPQRLLLPRLQRPAIWK